MTTEPTNHSEGSHGTFSHRPIIWGTNGMVGAGTQLTAQAGMRILQKGGNAFDAAAASALAGGVVEPTAHYTLGGEIALMLYDAKSKKVESIIGQGWAPKSATIELYQEKWGEIPPGILSTTVPGVVSAVLTMLSRHGTMTFAEVAESAIKLANEGFPAYGLFAKTVATPERQANLKTNSDSARIFLPEGKPPQLGDIFKQPELAQTLLLMQQAEHNAKTNGDDRETAIEAARDIFYKGDISKRMVEAIQKLGGLHTYEDFSEYTSPLEVPISVNYRGYEVYTNQTWTQGISLLQTLNILEGYDLSSLGHNSAEVIHLQVEALKLAFADREMYAGDPNLVDVPFKGLLSKEYATLRRDLLDTEKAQVNYPPGDPRNMSAISDIHHPQKPNTSYESLSESDGTTYLSTADSEGNMVSATPSTFGGLEQGMVLGDTGIVINCRGSYFWLDPDNANALQPRKRPRTTPCAFIILKDGRPVMTLGTPGGDNQIQSNLQVLNNIVDFELDVQEAVSAPRFCGYSFPRSPWPHSWDPNRLAIENRINGEVASELSAKEHNVQIIGPWGIVNGFTPIISNGHNFAGGADPRRDAVMLGW